MEELFKDFYVDIETEGNLPVELVLFQENVGMGKEQDRFSGHCGVAVMLEEVFESAAMIVMTVRDDDIVGLSEVDAQGFRVPG